MRSPWMLLWIVGACADPPEPRVEDLTKFDGCGDAVFSATSGRTAVLAVYVDGLLTQARTRGMATVTTFTLPDARVELSLSSGAYVPDPCDDSPPRDPQIHAVYLPTSGTATFTVTPVPNDLYGMGSLELAGVTLESGRSILVIDHMVIGPVPLYL